MATIANLTAKLVLDSRGVKVGTQEATREFKGLQASVGKVGMAIKGFFALEAVRIGMDVIRTGVSIFNNLRASIDETSKSARKLGMSFQDLRALKLTASLGGIDEAGLNTALTQMQNRLADAAGGKGEAADTLGRLGLNPEKLKAAGPIGALKHIANAMQDVENEADRIQIAMDLFGRQGADMLAIMEGGAAGVEAQLRMTGGILGDMTDKEAAAVERLNDNLEILWAGMKSHAEIGLGKLADDLTEANSKATFLNATLAMLPGIGLIAAPALVAYKGIDEAREDLEEQTKRGLKLDEQITKLPYSAAGNERREREQEAERWALDQKLKAATEGGVKFEEQLASKLQSITEGDFAARLTSWTNAAAKAGMKPEAIEAQSAKLREQNRLVEEATARQKELAEAAEMIEDSKTAWDAYADTLAKINRYAAQGLIPEQAQNRLAEEATGKLRSAEGLEPSKTAAEEYAASIEKFNRGLAAGVVSQEEFNRLVDEARQKYEEMAEQENPLLAKAKDLAESLKTPIEELDQQMREIDQMVKGGLLRADLGKRAKNRALEEYADRAKIGTVKERPEALGRYTDAGYNAAYAAPFEISQDKMLDLAQQQLDEHRRTNVLLEAQQKVGIGGPSRQAQMDALTDRLLGGSTGIAEGGPPAWFPPATYAGENEIQTYPSFPGAAIGAQAGEVATGEARSMVEQLLRQIAEQHLVELRQHTGYLQKIAAAEQPKVATIGR